MEQAEVTWTVTADAVIIRLAGDIDLYTVNAATAALGRVADALPPPGLVVLDLDGVEFIAACGLRMMCAFVGTCAQRGVETRVAVGAGSVVRVLLGGLDSASSCLHIFDSVAAALSQPTRAQVRRLGQG